MYLGKKTKQALLNHQHWFKHELLNIVCEQQMSSNWGKLVNKQQLSFICSITRNTGFVLRAGPRSRSPGLGVETGTGSKLPNEFQGRSILEQWETGNMGSHFSGSGWAKGAASGQRTRHTWGSRGCSISTRCWREPEPCLEQPWSSQPSTRVAF